MKAVLILAAALILTGCASKPTPTEVKCTALHKRVQEWTSDVPSPERENLLAYFDAAAKSDGCHW